MVVPFSLRYISCISYILYIFYFHYINYLHYIIVQAKPLHVSFRRNLDDQQSTLFKVLCVTVLKISLITPTFSSEYNLINLLKQASVKGIVTIAVTFVFIAGQCDLTVGASTALSAMICALLMSDHGWSPWSAIAVSVLCTLLVGVINGFIVYELKVVPFIATLGIYV